MQKSLIERCLDVGQTWIFFLEGQRLRGDLKEVDKIMRGMDRVDRHYFFPQSGNVKD